MEIREGNLDDPQVQALIAEHVAHMRASSPPESTHTLDNDELRSPDVTFYSMWDGANLASCGALKVVDDTHAEIKSMRTSTNYLRRGLAVNMLEHLISVARHRGCTRVSLETGSQDTFIPACKLYEKAGFTYCEPFGDYVPDPNSLFMTRTL